MNDDDQYFETTDLGLSTTIVTLGFRLHSLDRSNPSRVKFVFRREDELEDIVRAYWQKELSVEPLSYFNNIKLMKNRIYSR